MRRYKSLRAPAAGLLVLLGVGTFVLWPRPDRVTRRNFFRLTPGITRSEVETLLGPPGDFRTGPTRAIDRYGWREPYSLEGSASHLSRWDWGEETWDTLADAGKGDGTERVEWQNPNGTYCCRWTGDTAAIWVIFSPTGVARFATTCPLEREDRSRLNDLIWRIRCEWRRLAAGR